MARERYGMNMTQAEADRLAWVIMAVLYVLTALPLGLLLTWMGVVGGAGIIAITPTERVRAVVFGLVLIVGPIIRRHAIHRHFSPRRTR